MEPQESRPSRLSDLRLQAILKQPRTDVQSLPDGTVPGLALRISKHGTATWTVLLRVAGEAGVNEHGKQLLGKKYRLSIGAYPLMSIKAARAQANVMLEQAARGVNPKDVLKGAATAKGLTVAALGKAFLTEHIHSRELDSVPNYKNAFKTHINPQIGEKLAELVTREDARDVMAKARVKRKRPGGVRGGLLGGVEAARTTIGVLRHMYSWAILERKVKRQDNPCTLLTKNLPAKRQGEVVLTLDEARIVYQAAGLCGFPFGSQVQLEFLTALRLDNWASAEEPWVDPREALIVIPADSYKSDHVHVMPLVPQAMDILNSIPKPRFGPYLLSNRGGKTPIVGAPKFYRTRLQDAIIAINGEPLAKHITSQTIRRTVATRVAEILGYEGEKLVKRILGHADGSVTAIYNRFGYVRQMRQALEHWANDLTGQSDRATHAAAPATEKAA